MAKPAGPPLTQPVPGKPEERPLAPQSFAPSFYLTAHQPLSPAAILLAVVVAMGALSAILYVMSHAMSNPAGGTRDTDDPDQVDVIVIGARGDAAARRHPGEPSSVHPTVIVHLPRLGEQVGFIPNTASGRLLYGWLAAFNQGSYPALANIFSDEALAPVTAAQLQFRRQTGGLSLLSAKEVEPGILVFRLRDQTPAATEFLGTLQVRANASPAAIASFRLQAVPSPRQDPAAVAAPRSPVSP